MPEDPQVLHDKASPAFRPLMDVALEYGPQPVLLVAVSVFEAIATVYKQKGHSAASLFDAAAVLTKAFTDELVQIIETELIPQEIPPASEEP